MTADTAQADAFANGQREAAESRRLALVTALHLPPETTWEEALARVVPVAAGAKGCRGCGFDNNGVCSAPPAYCPTIGEWIRDHLGPDLLTPKPGAPECPGRVQKEQG